MKKTSILTATLVSATLLLTGCSPAPYDLAQEEYEIEASQVSMDAYPDIDLTFNDGYLDTPHSESDATELLNLLSASCAYAIENGVTEDRGTVAKKGRLATVLFPLPYAEEASATYNNEHGILETFGLSYYEYGSLHLFPYTTVRTPSSSGETSFRQSAPILPCSFVTSQLANKALNQDSNGLIVQPIEDVIKISDTLYQTRYPAVDQESQPELAQWRFNNGLLESVIKGEESELTNSTSIQAAKYTYGDAPEIDKQRFKALLTEKINPYIGDPEYPEWLDTSYQPGYTIADYNEADTVELIEILALSCNYRIENGAVIKGRTYEPGYPEDSERSILPSHIWEDITEVIFPKDNYIAHSSEEPDYNYIGLSILKDDISEETNSIIDYSQEVMLIAEYNAKYNKNIPAPVDISLQRMPCSNTIGFTLMKLLEKGPPIDSAAIPLAVKISDNLYQFGMIEDKGSSTNTTEATQIRIGANGIIESFIEFNYDFPIQENVYYIEYGSEATEPYLGRFQQQTRKDKFESWLYNTFPFFPLW